MVRQLGGGAVGLQSGGHQAVNQAAVGQPGGRAAGPSGGSLAATRYA